MKLLAAIVGIIVLLIILWDGFEVIILPRRVARRLRLSRLFYLVHLDRLVVAGAARPLRQAPRTLSQFLRTALAAAS